MTRLNPFEPQSPVSEEMFVGRSRELSVLQSQMHQTKAGRPSHFVLVGERGIGKSSLLNYAKSLSRQAPTSAESLNLVVVDTELTSSTTQIGLMRKIEHGLNRELRAHEPLRGFLASTWDFLQRVEAAGVRLNGPSVAPMEDTVLETFAEALAATTERLCGSTARGWTGRRPDGILLLIDEADKGKNAQLGLFIKLLSERLGRLGCSHVMIGLAGLPETREVLMDGHPSSLRVLQEIRLDRLWDEEVLTVIERCLGRAANENSTRTTMSLGARQTLLHLSEGLPHFIQQFGYSAFEVDTDDHIDENDVTVGAFGRNGALKAIGDQYYRDSFYNRIQNDSYREVLRIMAQHLDGWVTKADIRKAYSGSSATLNNALQALRERGIVLSKEGSKGVYRLEHKGFARWIDLFTSDPETLERRFLLPHIRALRE